jgi:hypothetical protein
LGSYEDLRKAVAELDVVKELESIIHRCLAENPLDRPKDCREVNALIKIYWARRSAKIMDRSQIYLKVAQKVVEVLGAKEVSQAQEHIIEDLSDAPVIVSTENTKNDEPHFVLHGEAWAYRIAFTHGSEETPFFQIIAAFKPYQNQVQRAREDGFALEGVDFKFGMPADRAQTSRFLEGLLYQISEHEAAIRSNIKLIEKRRLLGQWRAQIDARSQVEKVRESPVSFRSVQRDGRRATFKVIGSTTNIEVGQVRQILSASGSAMRVRGIVEAVDDEDVLLYLDDEAGGIPQSGKLVVDTLASRIKIQREKAAVDILDHAQAKAARPDLSDLLFAPDECKRPIPLEISDWFRGNLDESKKEAVRAALGCKDFFLVQGPPGTGKTTFIAEVVAQQLKLNPASRVLITSQTNIALDNALDQIERSLGGESARQIIRLADPKFGKVAPEAERFRVEGQLKKWREEVESRSNFFLEAWIEGRGVSRALILESRFLSEIGRLISTQCRLEDELSALNVSMSSNPESALNTVSNEEFEERIRDLEDQLRLVHESATLVSRSQPGLTNKHRDAIDRKDFQNLIGLADGMLGNDAIANELRSLVQLQTDWLMRLNRSEGFVNALVQDAAVIGATCVGLAAVRELSEQVFDLCIVDECSKATATETIIPLTRSKRWILVGDERQLPPMVEDALRNAELVNMFGIDRSELEATVFSRLSNGLPPENRRMLREQHRMVGEIGDLISECFYESQLVSLTENLAQMVPHVLPKPVTWHDTSKLSGREERKSPDSESSFVNNVEARHAASIVRKLAEFFREASIRPRVLVIAPYLAQVRELRRQVEGLGAIDSIHVEVATVDSVQGREADFVVFSVTRSNAEGNVGFLKLDARANVALSRARNGLIIIGDMSFCLATETPFKEVAYYVKKHQDSCSIVEVIR